MTAIEELWAARSEALLYREVRERTAVIGDPALVSPPAPSAAVGSPRSSSPDNVSVVDEYDDDLILGDLSGIYRRTVSA